MISIQSFVFNPFQENTYLIYDESGDAIVIDPGCYNTNEESELREFIAKNKLQPKKLINTHCHLDHIFGNQFIAKTFDLKVEAHAKDEPTFLLAAKTAQHYGLQYKPGPAPVFCLIEGEKVKFGHSTFEVLFLPGHAPGHVALINHEQKLIFSGDVLFRESIGRTDLPGGDHNTLIKSIKEKLFLLGDDYKVYPGHGPITELGWERKNNPFL